MEETMALRWNCRKGERAAWGQFGGHNVTAMEDSGRLLWTKFVFRAGHMVAGEGTLKLLFKAKEDQFWRLNCLQKGVFQLK